MGSVGVVATQALQAGLYGVLVGAVYALVALGVVLIFRSTKIVNFAHGEFAVLGAFVFLQLSVLDRAPAPVGVIGAAVAVALAGLAWGRLALMMEKRADDLVPVIGSLGVFIALDGLIVRQWGGNQPYRFPSILPRLDVQLGDQKVPSEFTWTLVAAVAVCIAMVALFRWTSLGLQLRAAVQNREAAELLGIPTRRLALYTWVIGSELALLAALIWLPRSFLLDSSMDVILLSAFAGAAVGGFESFVGAVIGSLVLGLAQALASRYLGSSVQAIVGLALIAILVYANPTGVFVVRGVRA